MTRGAEANGVNDQKGRETPSDDHDRGRGNHGSLGQIEMTGSARQVRDNERNERAIKPCPNPIEGLDRKQPIAIIRALSH